MQPVESLERRIMLSRAVDAAISPLDAVPAARYAPASKSLWKSGGYLSKAAAGNPADIALSFFKSNAASFGITAADIGTPLVTGQYTDADTGITHIYWRQNVNGLQIGNADANANVARDGRILSINSAFIPGVATVLNGKKITPGLSATTALLRAADNLGIAHRVQPAIVQPLAGGAMIGKLRSAELSQDDIATRLHYVVAPDGPHLAWNFILNLPSGAHWYDASVDANTGALLWTADWTSHDDFGPGPTESTQKATTRTPTQSGAPSAGSAPVANYNATYNVYPYPTGKNPDSAGRSLVANPWDLAASPFGWQDTNGDANAETIVTAGNNVAAQDDLDSNNMGGVQPAASGSAANQTYDFPINLNNAPSTYTSAATVNLYYWNNIIHDIHYRYGFTEAAGNFQLNNYGNGGLANDRVNADAQDGGGTNNANFSTPIDGSSGRMQMYVWNYTTPSRDGDLDASIMIHEYGHGVSTRLTGGPANSNSLNQLQSGGMGEGWGDWWALMLLQTDGAAAALNGSYPLAQYSIGENASSPGLRRYPYSFDKSINPMTFTMFNQSTEVHATGEVWTSTLWDMSVLLEKKYGFNPNIAGGYTTPTGSGNLLALRLVMDALKLQPSNPTLVQARDAILQADTALNAGADFREIWAAFARRGLGSSAATSGAGSSSLTLGWDMPTSVANNPPIVTHSTPISANYFSSLSSVTFQFSLAMNTATFSTASDINFTGPGAVNLNGQITSGAWGNGNKTLTVFFNAQSTDGTYTMTIGPNIQVGGSATNMDQDFDGVAGEASDSYTATIALDTRPGPDATGYVATPTTFQNINLVTGGGTNLLDNQDDTSASINLGANTFRFYGVNYTGSQLFVSENGYVTFGSGQTVFNNGNVTFSPATPMIAALFDDWATDATAADKVLYKLDAPNNKLIIEWSAITNRGDGNAAFDTNPATFQAILSLNTGSGNGDILFNYVDLNIGPASSPYINGGSATVAIKAAGTQGANGNNNRLLLSLFNNPNTWLASNSAISIGVAAAASGTVFADNDGDGVIDAGEAPISGATVYQDVQGNGLLDAGEPFTTTDGSGNYTLNGLPSGPVTLRSIVGPTWVETQPALTFTATGGTTSTGKNIGEFNTTITGTGGNEAYVLRLNAAQDRIEILINNTLTYSILKNRVPTLRFDAGAGTDSLTIDYVNGDPTLLLLPNVRFTGSGSDTLAVTGPGGITVQASQLSDTPNLTLSASNGATMTLAAAMHLNGISVNNATMTASFGSGTFVTNSLSITGTGKFNLQDNDMIVFYSGSSPLSTIATLIRNARNGGAWNGNGLTSSTAAARPAHDTSPGAIDAADYRSVYGANATFNGEPIAGQNAVLIKYTYYGDSDFNGKVDGADYARVDSKFNQQTGSGDISGWFNGDFDYNDKIDGADYALIDAAFNSQLGTL